jgi:hypothetical protein
VRMNDDPWRDRVLIDSVDYIEGSDRFANPVYYKPLRIQGWLTWTTRVFHSNRISIYFNRINHFRKGAYNYYYYTKDDGRPKRLSMKDVSRDVADDPTAMIYIKRAKVAKGISTTLTCVGGAMSIASMFVFSTRDALHPVVADDRMPGLFVGGVSFLSMPFFVRSTWQRNLVEGLESYGREIRLKR